MFRLSSSSVFLKYFSRYYSTSINVINPATKQQITTFSCDSVDDIIKKSDLARKTQNEWKRVPIKDRINAIRNYRNTLSNKDTINEFGKSLSLETGKPISQATGEIKATLERIDYFIDNVEEIIKSKEYPDRSGVKESLSYEPIGVIGNISAWNYPYFVGHNVIIPAILTGNTVLYKPSEYALLTGNHITKLLNNYLPENVFQNIIGDGSIGESLLTQVNKQENRLIDGIFFTGSNATGIKIAEKAGKQLMKIQLELGGKDSSYIHKDVDIDSVSSAIADGCFYNNGQSCCSVERVYIHEDIYNEFIENLLEKIQLFKMGDPLDSSTYLGPLTRPQQADILDIQIKDALDKGAILKCGGKRTFVNNELSGVYYKPTVLINCTPDMLVVKEESFGPIVAISSVSNSLDDVIYHMNNCNYGLTNSIYSKDKIIIDKILPELQSGTVYWNSCDRVSPQLPWSGRKGSGIGATLGEIGISCFVQPKGYHLNYPKQ